MTVPIEIFNIFSNCHFVYCIIEAEQNTMFGLVILRQSVLLAWHFVNKIIIIELWDIERRNVFMFIAKILYLLS